MLIKLAPSQPGYSRLLLVREKKATFPLYYPNAPCIWYIYLHLVDVGKYTIPVPWILWDIRSIAYALEHIHELYGILFS